MFKTQDEAYAELNGMNYVPTQEEQEQIRKHEEKAEWWIQRGTQALWATDGVSLTAFVSSAASEDELKHAERIKNGGLGVFRVFVRLADNKIVAHNPEHMHNKHRPWQNDWKWVVRGPNGRMQKDDQDRWMIYPFSPARMGTHENRGYGERWVVLPYKLVSGDESIGDAMKRGTAVSQLARKITT